MYLTKSTLHESYSDSEFEIYFQKLEIEQLAKAKIEGKSDGLMNDPISKRQHNILFIAPLKSVFQKALDYNAAKFQPISSIATLQNQRNSANEEVRDLSKTKKEEDQKLEIIKNQLKELKEKLKPGISFNLRKFIAIAFGLCEGAMVFFMLANTSLPLVMSFFAALLVALMGGVGVYLAANFICKAKTLNQKRIRWAIILIIGFAVSLALGIWRANTFSDITTANSQIELSQSSGSSQKISAWPFALISFIAFLVALSFEIKYWLTDDEKKLLKKYQEKHSEVKKAEQLQQTTQNKIKSIKINSANDSSTGMRIQEYAATNEWRLVSLAQEVINCYESANVDSRKDRQCPDFFGEQIDFRFKLYFTHFFNSIKEKQ